MVLAKRPGRTQEGAAGYFSSQAPLRKDMALFMRIDYRSRNSLVGGTTWLWQLRGGIWSWRGLASGTQFWVGRRVAAPDLGLCAPDRLFLGMWFVPQERVYLRHRLRGQLAQHLEGTQMFYQLLCTRHPQQDRADTLTAETPRNSKLRHSAAQLVSYG